MQATSLTVGSMLTLCAVLHMCSFSNTGAYGLDALFKYSLLFHGKRSKFRLSTLQLQCFYIKFGHICLFNTLPSWLYVYFNITSPVLSLKSSYFFRWFEVHFRPEPFIQSPSVQLISRQDQKSILSLSKITS